MGYFWIQYFLSHRLLYTLLIAWDISGHLVTGEKNELPGDFIFPLLFSAWWRESKNRLGISKLPSFLSLLPCFLGYSIKERRLVLEALILLGVIAVVLYSIVLSHILMLYSEN